MEGVIKELKAELEEAFDKVILGNGIGLIEAQVKDDYGSKEDRAQAKAIDIRRDWKQLIDHEFIHIKGGTGLAFFDDHGMRFHLPAYIWTFLNNVQVPDYTLVYNLTTIHEYNRYRFRLLDQKQKVVITHFLEFVHEYLRYSFEDELEQIEIALENYWRKDD